MSSTRSPFLSLPREIRDMIYGYLLASETCDTVEGAHPEATVVIGNINPFPGFNTMPLIDQAHEELHGLGQNPMEEQVRDFMEQHRLFQICAKPVQPFTWDGPNSMDLHRDRYYDEDERGCSKMIPTCRTRYHIDWTIVTSYPYPRGHLDLCQTITGGVETSYERQGGVIHPSVLYVNQQIHDEAEQILYSKNTFRFKKDSTEAIAPFLKDRSAAARAVIKSLRVRLCTMEKPDSFASQEWDKCCIYIAEELHLRILRLDLDNEDEVNDSTDYREYQFRWDGPTSGWVRSLIRLQTLPSLDICTQWSGNDGYQSEVNWNLLDHLESNMPQTSIREVPSRTPPAGTYGKAISCADSLFKDWHVDRRKADPTYRAEITEYYKRFYTPYYRT
ncbi:MAG: hypothetical protein M1836_004101 [Candelina mexicana]|nr:MAG: hypothetical protein M1836_004101 [Candelina mexicana]